MTESRASAQTWPAAASLEELGVVTSTPAAVARRGILECYYGTVWTPTERREMIRIAQQWGINTYVYGPADDPHTGSTWNEPYTQAELDEFRALTAFALDHGVELVWRVSPSAPLRQEAAIRFVDDDAEVLCARLSEMVDVGISTVLIAFDDIATSMSDEDRARFADDAHPVAAAQAWLIGFVRTRLPDLSLIVCPTLYWGTSENAYLRRFFELLPVDVSVVWTGPDVVSASISGSEARGAAERAGRPVWLWDNHPVNDWGTRVLGGEVPRRIFLTPVRDREPQVADHIAAYAVNLQPAPAGTLGVVASAAAWAWDPTAYDPVEFTRSFAAAMPSGEAFAVVQSALSVSGLQVRDNSVLAPAIWRYLAALDSGDPELPVESVLAAAAEILAAVQTLPVDDARTVALQPWVDELARQTAAIPHALEVIDAHLAQDNGRLRAAADICLAAVGKATTSAPAVVLGGAGEALLLRAITACGTAAPEVDF